MDTKTPPSNESTRDEAGGPTYEAIHSDRNHRGRDRDSISTIATDDHLGHSSEKYNEKSVVETGNGVNISRAEAEFAQLNKELSRTSNISRKLSRTQSRQSHKNQTIADVEKGQNESETSSDEPFDLESVLRGNRNEEEAAGIKSKRIGVVWDGLTVCGIGGVKNYVKVSILFLCLFVCRCLAVLCGRVVGWLFCRQHGTPQIITGANFNLRHFLTPSCHSSTSTRHSRVFSVLARREESSTFSRTSKVLRNREKWSSCLADLALGALRSLK
jgi:hypothetical protein